MGIHADLLREEALGDGAEHGLGRFCGGKVGRVFRVLGFHEAHPAGAAGGEHGPSVLIPVGEAPDELAALLHDRQVGGEIGVEHIVEAQRPEGGGHLPHRGLLPAEAQLLRPGGAHGGRHLHDGGDLRVLQSRRDLGGVVPDGEGAGGTVGDALAAEGAVRLGEETVQTDAHGGAGAAALHIPDLQGLDLVADLDAAHALDALGLLADQVAVLRPLVFLYVLGIGVVDDVQLAGKLLQLAVLVAHTGGAVAVMLGEEQLQVGLPGVLGPVGIRMDDHALGDLFGAGGDKTLKAIHLNHADAAGGDLVYVLQIAEGGDVDACGSRCFHDRGTFGGKDFPPVDRQLYHFVSLPPLKLPKPK